VGFNDVGADTGKLVVLEKGREAAQNVIYAQACISGRASLGVHL
jgi:hypothetical protein